MAGEEENVGCCGNCGSTVVNCNCPAGPQGEPGTTGTSITNVDAVQLGDEFYLRIFYSNGGQEDVLLPLVPGEDGTSIQGPAGEDGSKILFNATVDNAIGSNDDVLIHTSTFDVYLKISGVWVLQGNIQGPAGPAGPQGVQGPAGANGTNGADGANGTNGLGYDLMTSLTSINVLDTSSITVSMTITTNKALIAGSRVRVADSANPTDNFFEGVVTSYNAVTGALDIGAIDTKVGSGTIASWNLSITGQRNVPPTWTALTLFTTGFSASTLTGHYDPAYWVDQILDICHFSGAVEMSNTSGGSVVNPNVLSALPVFLRPASNVSIPVNILNNVGLVVSCNLQINSSTGAVTIDDYTAPAGDDFTVFFDNVSYRIS